LVVQIVHRWQEWLPAYSKIQTQIRRYLDIVRNKQTGLGAAQLAFHQCVLTERSRQPQEKISECVPAELVGEADLRLGQEVFKTVDRLSSIISSNFKRVTALDPAECVRNLKARSRLTKGSVGAGA